MIIFNDLQGTASQNVEPEYACNAALEYLLSVLKV